MTTADKKPIDGCRRIAITVVLHIYENVPLDTEDGGRFWVEELHCLDNYINEIADEKDKEPNTCHTCYRGKAFLGHIPLGDIERVQAATTGHGVRS